MFFVPIIETNFASNLIENVSEVAVCNIGQNQTKMEQTRPLRILECFPNRGVATLKYKHVPYLTSMFVLPASPWRSV